MMILMLFGLVVYFFFLGWFLGRAVYEKDEDGKL